MQQQVAQEYDRDPESKVRRPVKIPVLEHSNTEVEGERRKSPRLAAKKNDTTPAMKKDNENSKLQKIGVRFQTESQPAQMKISGKRLKTYGMKSERNTRNQSK
jgi:hypothetical protein